MVNGTLSIPNPSGEASFTLTIPVDYKRPDVVVHLYEEGASQQGIQTVIVGNPAASTPAILTTEGHLLYELYSGAKYDNRPNGEPKGEELAELKRFASVKGGQPLAALMAAPAASGGDMKHQAEQSRVFIELAAALNHACTSRILAAAKKADQIDAVDEHGNKINAQTYFNLAEIIRNVIPGQAVSNITALLSDINSKHGQVLQDMATESLENVTAFVRAVRGTDTWQKVLKVAEISGGVVGIPFVRDLDNLSARLTDEGVAEFIVALSRFTLTVSLNTGTATSLALNDLDAWLTKLNGLAGNDIASQLVVGYIGYTVEFIKTGTGLIGTGADGKGVKRMMASMLATTISAYWGNQGAKDELKRLCPFWSWIFISKDVARLWDTSKYYEAGQMAFRLVLQAAGDVTLAIGVVKGGIVVVQRVSGAVKVIFRPAMQKTAQQTIVRGALPPPVPNEMNKLLKARIGQFPPMGYGPLANLTIEQASQLCRVLCQELAEAVTKAIKNGASDLRHKKIAVAIDLETGKAYAGISLQKDASLFPRFVDSRLTQAMPRVSLEKWAVENCAEFNALNDALLAGGDPTKIVIRTVHVDSIKFFEPCKNCRIWVDKLGLTLAE
ncbi:MAG: hypothetical protein JNM99_02055 [Verrucomicrobiaceae bacterium]|nr:hypothetical protein [Verrucomicrobiaceae bacterium]